ncbi:hypothetical protein ACFPOU_15795 [Massilia jejuensis]|uniref:DUF2946 domain-containing protein n=1 Tax=Massilia jejuensis TaxID=648894 RepID=A0ABW0PKP6_9BURK
MMRRCLVHVLLSLVLLASQQMAFAHAMSHWTVKLGSNKAAASLVQGDPDRDPARAVARDQGCGQCLAFAQVASAIGSGTRHFFPLDLRTERVAALAGSALAPRTVRLFDSRAPPSFV